MKHIFVVNPNAGKKNSVDDIRRELEEYSSLFDTEIYETKAPKDAEDFVKNYCKAHTDEEVCFYACGGDGTLNEVLNGMVGFDNALLSVYPCGSGNDFIKYYGGSDCFLDIKNLLNGHEEKIDVLKAAGRYAINVVNFGFDTYVVKTMQEIKKKPIIGGKNAYTTGIVKALLKAMKTKCTVYKDGKPINEDGRLLLCTLANAQFVGGAFRCAPRARVDDGLLEICMITPVSRLKFLRLIGEYKTGDHLDSKRFDDCRIYLRSDKVEIKAPKGFSITLDGEIIDNNECTVEVVPKAIRFFVPQGAKAIEEKREALSSKK